VSKKEFKKAEVFTLSAAHLSHDTFSAMLPALLPLLIDKLGLTLSMSAMLDIVRRIPALFNPFLGLIAERTGIRYFVILTPAITALSMGLVGLAPSFWALMVLLFIAGVSAALFHVRSPVMVREVSGTRVGTGMSFFMVGGELARTLGPLLIIAAVSWWGLEQIYRLVPIGLAASLVLFVKLRNYKVPTTQQRGRERGDTRRVLHMYLPLFGVIALYILFQTAVKSALTLYLPVYLTQQGESLWYAGISLSILQFFGVIGTFCAGNISDRIGRQNTLLIAALGSVIAMGLFVAHNSVVLLAFLGFFIFASGPVLMATIQDVDSHMPTFMNSMYMFINFGVGSLVVFVMGALGDSLGLQLTYQICVVAAMGAIPTALLVKHAAKAREI